MVELVDRSMVEPDAIGHTRRYRLLETLRHYGSELLDKHGGDAARHAHAEHYADLAVALAALAAGPEQGIALEQYELEVANVRAAFERSLAADDIELAGRIAEVAVEFAHYWLDYEAVAWAEAVCEPARARRLPIAITLIAIVRLRVVPARRPEQRAGPDRRRRAARRRVGAAASRSAPRAIKADLLALRDPAAAVVVYDELAADGQSAGGAERRAPSPPGRAC